MKKNKYIITSIGNRLISKLIEGLFFIPIIVLIFIINHFILIGILLLFILYIIYLTYIIHSITNSGSYFIKRKRKLWIVNKSGNKLKFLNALLRLLPEHILFIFLFMMLFFGDEAIYDIKMYISIFIYLIIEFIPLVFTKNRMFHEIISKSFVVQKDV